MVVTMRSKILSSPQSVPPEGNTSLRLRRSFNCHTRLQTRITVKVSPIGSLAQRFKAHNQTSKYKKIKGGNKITYGFPFRKNPQTIKTKKGKITLL